MATLNKAIPLPQLKRTLPLFLALLAAGLAGNYFKFSIFLNVDFIFGSIFAMLALQFFGKGRGILAAVIISSYTWILWNHPYSFIIMTAETAVVGWLMARRMGMVLADTLYWLLIGMPLVFLSFSFVMYVSPSDIYIVMTKQAVNGIANALIARLIFTGFVLRSHAAPISYRETIYNLLAFFVLCPALIMLAVGSRTDLAETERHVRTSLIQDSRRLTNRVETWVLNRKSAILTLAEMAASRSPGQMQPYLELAKRSDVNFLRIGLHDREATTIAYVPLIDELGRSTIGRNFADRPFIPKLKQNLQPMLSDVALSRTGLPRPRVAVLAPVVIRGAYGGYVFGALGLEQIREHLIKSTDGNNSLYTLLDKNGNVIMTNRTDQKIMTPFGRGGGTLNRLDDTGISQWIPTLSSRTPMVERFKKSLYVAETAIGDLAEWKLILEQPVAPFQKTLYDNYTGKFMFLFLILLGALALAEIVSRRIVVALEQLHTLTHELPVRLAKDSPEIDWPESGLTETTSLIDNFREMADSLSELFIETRQINESLEQRVADRTEELRKREEAYRIVADFTYDWEYWKAPDDSLRYISPSCERHTGYRAEEFRRDPDLMDRITHPEDRDQFADHMPVHPNAALQHHMNFRIRTRSGEERWFAHVCQPIYAGDGQYLGQRASNRDITEHQRAEADKDKLAAQNRQLQKTESLGRMAGAIAHTFNNQLGAVIGNLELATMSLTPGAGPVHSLTAAMQAAQKAAEVSGQMLTYLGQSFDKREPLDIAEVCRRNLPILRAGLPGKVVLETDLPSPGCAVVANENEIQQVLTNLITNAWEAFGEGRGAIRLAVKTVPPADIPTAHRYPLDWQPQDHAYACIQVTDAGCGIADKDIENLFDPFFSSKFTGRGLGLAVVLGILKAHGGAVSVESALGQGSAFRVFLPVSGAAIPRQADQAVETRERSGSGTILLAEDEEMVRDMAKAMLTSLGFIVLEAKDGVEAVEMFRQNREEICLVVCDLTMPRLNGWETLTALRKLAPGLPVILASGYDKARVMAGDHPEWPQVFLGKPYKFTELSDAIDQALAGRKK